MRVVRDANASRFRDPFESGRDVNAIAEYVVVVENDVADMNADAEFDPHFLRNAGILSCHFALDLDRAARCIHHTGKFRQHTVAGRLDDTAAMHSDGGVDDGLPQRLQVSECTFFVAAHQAAVAGDIRRQHRRQPPFHALVGQKSVPKKFNPTHQGTRVRVGSAESRMVRGVSVNKVSRKCRTPCGMSTPRKHRPRFCMIAMP
jgi:hypothetical protein